jgi:ABC-type nitrate/sulfonate/bicarbonate transport system substrate-binding protein
MKRYAFVTFISLAIWFAALPPQRSFAAKIVVGISSVNVAFLPLYVTIEKGYFKDEGLDIVPVMFNAGNTNVQALIGGDVQIMAGAVAETVIARASGIDIKNFWGICNLMPFELYSQPKLTSMKEAKGKRFAISRFGSLSDFLTRASLLHFGIDPKDVTILQIGSTPARFAALSSGGVDATIIWFPVTEQAKALGYRKLFDLKDMYPQWPYEAFAARESWLTKERDQANRFLRAYRRGVRHTRENREEAIAALRKFVKMDPADAPAGYDLYRDSFPLDGKMAEKGIGIVIDQEFETGRLKKKLTIEDMVDRSFIAAFGKK